MAIIGISGRIGSGKDTVGRIIQYLTCGADKANISYEEWDGKTVWNTGPHKWEVKKFAAKLKQIVALLTGCTVEDLESQEFKMKNLPKEWEYVLDESHKPVATSKYEHDEIFIQDPQRFTKKYTYREMLQFIGTNALRDVIHEQIWVNALFADYKEMQIPPEFVEGGVFLNFNSEYPNWIITDMRFPNEFDAIKSRSGITIRVERPNKMTLPDESGSFKLEIRESQMGIKSLHPSEIALDNHNFDYLIVNDGSIEDLINKVKEILTLENILK